MKRPTTLLLAFLLSGIVSVAHEFWLQPGRYFYVIRDIAAISFRVGENFTGENWNGNSAKISQLKHYTPNGELVDISGRLSDKAGDSIALPLQQEGTHMVIFNGTNSHIELEPGAFEDYLKEDGLVNALQFRREHGETNKKGREYYQRSVKTIFQVGNTYQTTVQQPTTLPLDIIPLNNPYEPPGQSPRKIQVRYQILFKGKPLVNQLVKVWHRDMDGKTVMEDLKSNKRGIVETDRHTGPNMVSTVVMERLNNDPKADWQSYWGSLTFEYSRF
jgi:uncharacterized GH25 family protein